MLMPAVERAVADNGNGGEGRSERRVGEFPIAFKCNSFRKTKCNTPIVLFILFT